MQFHSWLHYVVDVAIIVFVSVYVHIYLEWTTCKNVNEAIFFGYYKIVNKSICASNPIIISLVKSQVHKFYHLHKVARKWRYFLAERSFAFMVIGCACRPNNFTCETRNVWEKKVLFKNLARNRCQWNCMYRLQFMIRGKSAKKNQFKIQITMHINMLNVYSDNFSNACNAFLLRLGNCAIL